MGGVRGTFMEILAERLRLLRKERKLTQEEFARFMGLSTGGYQRYELNEREPSASQIVDFSKYFDVSADFLLGLSDQR